MKLLKKFFFILCITALCNSSTTIAETETREDLLSVNELLTGCEEGSVPGAPNQYCMRYVFGLVQTVMGLQQAEQSAPVFCINPQATPLEEATDVVINYLRSQSTRSDEAAYILVTEALNKNYPCSSGSLM